MRPFPTSTYGRLMLLCAVVQAVVTVTLAAATTALFLRNADLVADTPARGTPTYLIVFCVSQLYQAGFGADAIWNRNTVQIAGFVLFNFVCLGYAVFQYFQVAALLDDPLLMADVTDEGALQSIRPALYIIPIVIGIFCVLYVFFAYKLYQEFSWKVYKKIGPEPRMRNMYRWYEVLLVCLKFDVFFGLAYAVQYVILQVAPNEPEFWATVFAMPVFLGIVMLGIWGVRKEDLVVAVTFFVAILLCVAYFVFQLVQVLSPSQYARFEYTWKYLTFFASISLFFLCLTLATLVVCLTNFGQGLSKLVSGVSAAEVVDVHSSVNGLQRAPTSATLRTPLEP
ncbi:hypothetical protein DFJ74DRAFT_665259 [Hyaloraphidium curvatum]|nr:hypothetical protein DFJ74DRAFT_665259 [Hyaloraphidium curvatum]